jgi:hypothetical protein
MSEHLWRRGKLPYSRGTISWTLISSSRAFVTFCDINEEKGQAVESELTS